MAVHYHGDPAIAHSLDAFVKLVRAADTVAREAHRELAAVGLTASQFGTLEAIYHLGPMCQRDLGRKLLKSEGNVTTVVNNLERRGLLRRVRRQDDRRFVSLELTEEGAALIREVFPVHAQRVRTLLHGPLDDAEINRLAELCRKLGRGLLDGSPRDA